MEQKISGNSFRKFRSTSRGCPFFWKFGNSGNFLFHLAFLSCMISALVSLVVNFASTKAKDSGESTLHWMQNDLPQFEPVLDCQSSTKAIGFDFSGKLWPGRFEFPVDQFAHFAYSLARKVGFFHHTKMMFESVR